MLYPGTIQFFVPLHPQASDTRRAGREESILRRSDKDKLLTRSAQCLIMYLLGYIPKGKLMYLVGMNDAAELLVCPLYR